MEELDHCFSTLNCRYDESVVHEMFRAVHSVKGNCHMVFLDGIADVCHLLEDIVAEIRKGGAAYTPPLGEFITLIFARLEQLVAQVVAGDEIREADILVLEKGVSRVYDAKDKLRDQEIQHALDSFSGLLSSAESLSDKVMQRLDEQPLRDDFAALEFMQRIAHIMQAKSVQHRGDLAKLQALALRLNALHAQEEEPDQLSAALSMLNLGSKFVASPVFDLSPDSPQWERQKAEEQLEISAGFLRIGEGWQRAAVMIVYSHERFDGKGPKGLKAERVPAGSMILSILRFYQQSYLRLKRDFREKIAVAKSVSLVHAEIGARFDPQLVEALVQIARDDPAALML
ncbi:Hpt domain-containing protein [Neptuniibacter halophilus]|uniref:Hpt domain-containing protein n=1 Tax=Neptuniibacter halophilus TaxID=651666 RepID=UPI0025729B6E|nr:Hpt domain-containing protein [Neptuniibacter halophilus]